MNTTPSSTRHFTSTATSDDIAELPPGHGDRPRAGQQTDAIRRARAAGERALVLGGGGGAGNAWEIGVIAGLFDAGLDVTEADLIIGTSAGSTAAAQITSAARPDELLASILAAAPQPRTGPAGSGRGRVPDRPAVDHVARTGDIIAAAADAADMRRRMGAAALAMDAASGSSGPTPRRAVVAARLPSQRWPQRPVLIVAVDAHTGEPVVFDRHSGVDLVDAVAAARLPSGHWPQRPLLIPAVDAHTGEPVVFDRHSGVDLVDAVTASCAGPGCPAHSIGGSRYIDGGYRSNENADLAAGYGRVLVLSPFGGRSRAPLDWGIHLAAQVDELRARGSRVETIFPDSDSEHMFGANAMDPSLRPAAARAGYNQGRALAEQLTDFWR